MQVIKNKQLIENHWAYLADDDPIVVGNICVSLARWQSEKNQLITHEGNLGVRIAPAEDVNQLVEDLPKLALIELAVSDFADGRSFSQAHLLRNRHAYQGEIRAVGNYLADQAFYFSRVGVNAFESEHLAQTQNTLNDFTVFYQ